MADNLQVTQGSGTTIAAKDEGSGVLLQRVWSEGFATRVTTDVTRPNDATQYSAGDCWADSTSAPTTGGFTLSSVARISGGITLLTDMVITSSVVSTMQGSIILFNTAVTAVNDNAAYAITDAEAKTIEAIVPFAFGNGKSSSNNATVDVQNLNKVCLCSGSANLRYLIRVDAIYTPSNNEVLTVVGHFLGVN